ncbi:MAG: hypothetical protein JW940_23515 [Polyangiaceae bacterium]|nr:hypothetical protein [Polyangiaceae bacterium]
MTIPTAGRLDHKAGKSITELFLESQQIVDWNDVKNFLLCAGYSSAKVTTAVDYYRTDLASEYAAKPRASLSELLGIDFHSPVERVMLPAGRTYLTYVKTVASAPAASRPNEGRVRLDASGQPLKLLLGSFLTDPGTAPDRLGISPIPPRMGIQLRALRTVTALKSRASGVVDAWSDKQGQLAVPRMAFGGGVQYRVQKDLTSTDDGFAVL